MTDEAELPGSGRPERGAGIDPAALAMDLAGASREKADRFLDEQIEVLRLQKLTLQHEIGLNLSHLRFRRFSDHTKSALEILAGLIILLIASGLGAMVWDATQDRDLVVEAFSVPPDMAQTGMTGAVLAARVLDRFGQMQADTFSIVQGAGSYHRDNPESVRVEIPETGISLGELSRYLRDWLGSETRVTGDLVHTQSGVALTVRYGAQPGVTLEGGRNDLDRLAQSAAEKIFAAARPLRFVDYLSRKHRFAQAEAIIPALAMQGSEHARSLAYSSWAALQMFEGDMYGTRDKALVAVRLDPKNPSALAWLSAAENNLEHEEGAFENLSATLRSSHGSAHDLLDPRMRASLPVFWTMFRDELAGDFSDAITGLAKAAAEGLPYYANHHVWDSAAEHDLGQARRVAAAIPAKSRDGRPNFDVPLAQLVISVFAGDWPGAVRWGANADAVMRATPERLWEERRDLWPPWAYALARNGELIQAEALIARTPLDCDDCVRKRGRIAAAAHDWAGATRWFAMVSARSPSIPFADTDWGEMLLDKGDYDSAIARFQIAHRKGPHFADPLEMWGEALMGKNRSDLALAKFEEANACAPNWGRLHLKWGEALVYAGRKDEANTQFASAARLQLSGSEKSELTRDLRS